MTQLMEERVSEKVPQTQVDTVFYEMVDRMEGLRALSYRPDTERVLLEAQRDAILGELLEKNPHEAVGEIMHALSLLYRDRSITTYEGTMEITEFATRDASNQRLDDHFTILRRDADVVGLIASYTDAPGLGYEVVVEGETVSVNVLHGSYRVPMNPHDIRTDGASNSYTSALRDFYLRSLTTAATVHERDTNDPVEARRANLAARAMLVASMPTSL